MAYQTVVVGTDGSDSSLRAVERAGLIAAKSDAKLIIATAYLPKNQDPHELDSLKDENYLVSGGAPVYAVLRTAHERAKAVGVKNADERAIIGSPVAALIQLADDVNADLLVVGNVGVNTLADRVLGSVPTAVSRRANTDVLIVHTAG